VIDYAYIDQGPIILPISGTYKATVKAPYAGATGDYAFRILDLSAAPQLALGTTTSGTLDPGERTDIYRFTGSPGQRLFFDPLAGDASNLSFSLIAPDGQTKYFVTDPTADKQAPFLLDAAGTYYLAVRGSDETQANPYSFRLWDVASAPA